MGSELMETVKVIPWTVLLQLSIVAIISLILKKYYDNISSYWMFRTNKNLGKNVKINVNGKDGYITHYTWRFIYVSLKESGNELIIPITKWTGYRWEVVRNGKTVEEK